MRKTYNSKFKFKVSLEAIRGDLTIAQIISKYGVSESMIHRWKKKLLDEGDEVFNREKQENIENSPDIEKLHAKIGELTLEKDFLENALLRYPQRSAKK